VVGQLKLFFNSSRQQKRVQVYPNGESVERTTYIWGDSFQQLLDSATMRLNLWQPAKRFFTMEGKEVGSSSYMEGEVGGEGLREE